MTNRDETTNLEDTMLVAYLQLMGHTAIPWISRDDPSDPRISFDIMGDQEEIRRNTQAFYNNASVGVQDFCRQLREVKSAMYNMKKVGKG